MYAGSLAAYLLQLGHFPFYLLQLAFHGHQLRVGRLGRCTSNRTGVSHLPRDVGAFHKYQVAAGILGGLSMKMLHLLSPSPPPHRVLHGRSTPPPPLSPVKCVLSRCAWQHTACLLHDVTTFGTPTSSSSCSMSSFEASSRFSRRLCTPQCKRYPFVYKNSCATNQCMTSKPCLFGFQLRLQLLRSGEELVESVYTLLVLECHIRASITL